MACKRNLSRVWAVLLLPLYLVACSEAEMMRIATQQQVPQKSERRQKEEAAQTRQGPADVRRQWKPLAYDGLHDPANPWLRFKQEPYEALSQLPPDSPGTGNQVLWVDAIEEGYINPRTGFKEQDPDGMLVMDMDIMRTATSIMPMVKFPHKAHTVWLDCDNCHRNNIIFKPQAKGTYINMFMVLNGEKCGQCHGAVAFPVTECYRCHSVPRPKIR